MVSCFFVYAFLLLYLPGAPGLCATCVSKIPPESTRMRPVLSSPSSGFVLAPISHLTFSQKIADHFFGCSIYGQLSGDSWPRRTEVTHKVLAAVHIDVWHPLWGPALVVALPEIQYLKL